MGDITQLTKLVGEEKAAKIITSFKIMLVTKFLF